MSNNPESEQNPDKIEQEQQPTLNLLEDDQKEPIEPSHWLPYLLGTFYGKVVDKGNIKPYKPDMLMRVPNDMIHQPSHELYGPKLRQMMKKSNLSLTLCTKLFLGYTIKALLIILVLKTVNLVFPLILKEFINWFQTQPNQPKGRPKATKSSLNMWEGLSYAIMIPSFMALLTLFSTKSTEMCNKLKLVTQNVIGSEVVLKVFRLHSRAASYLGYGKVAILINSDITKISEATQCFAGFLTQVYETLFCLYFIYKFVGFLCIFALILTSIFVYLQKTIFRRFLTFDTERRGLMDQRSRMVNEIVEGIKSLKFNALEKVMKTRIGEIRQKEVGLLWRMFESIGISLSISWSISPLTGFIIFTICRFFKTGIHIPTGTLFATLMYLNRLGHSLNALTIMLSTYYSSLSSFKRVDLALRLEEWKPEEIENLGFFYPNSDCFDGSEKGSKVGDASNGFLNYSVAVNQVKNEFSILRNSKKRRSGRVLRGGIIAENFSASWDDYRIKNQLVELSQLIKQKEKKKTKKGGVEGASEDRNQRNQRRRMGDEGRVDAEDGRELKTVKIGSEQEGWSTVPEINMEGTEKVILRDIDFVIEPKEFVVVIGKIGSGKSSLLRAITKDLKTQNGRLASNGSIAFVPQQAFLVNDTLRNNILFGKPFFEKKYKNVLKICQLRADLEILPCGDQTEIGERGINLSGGQKQRISLARAVYSDSDIYLIDDCLSALDAGVGKAVLDKVLLGHLKGKTVVMASQHTHFLDKADKIILMDQGSIALMGRHSEVKITQEYTNFVLEKHQQEKLKNEKEQKNEKKSKKRGQKSRQTTSEPSAQDTKTLELGGKLTTEEKRSVGIVDPLVLIFYAKSGGLLLYNTIVTLFILSASLLASVDWWAGKWFNNDFELTELQYLLIYFTLILLFVILSTAKSTLFGKFASNASKSMFRRLIWKILRKPLSFFDTTPSGVIINRAVDDMETGDLSFPKQLYTFFDFLFVIVTTYVLVVLICPFMVVVIAVCVLINCVTFFRYLRASTELKRIFRLSRSPVLSRVSEMVNGMTSIRLYNYQHVLKAKWEREHNLGISAQMHEFYCIIWVSIYNFMSIALIALILSLSIVYRKKIGRLSSDVAVETALVMQYVLAMTSFSVKLFSTLGALMTDACMIERLKEYCEMKGFEAEFELQSDHLIAGNWPQTGSVEIENLSVRYREGLPLVIKNFSLEVSGGSKVAVLGRTGSGKSTLMLTFMRILELSKDDQNQTGRICIDGVDISDLGLHKLRSTLSIIPQDPFLLEGTLRFNLDQLGVIPDAEMLALLQKINFMSNLQPQSSNLPREIAISAQNGNFQKKPKNDFRGILDYQIEPKGRNLSVGQRQMVCIARALLNKSKILLMDEATASIDKKLDRFIQEVLINDFKDCTVITIAHRIETILSYDQVVVMRDGRKVEQGTPRELYAAGGEFFGMVVESGLDFGAFL